MRAGWLAAYDGRDCAEFDERAGWGGDAEVDDPSRGLDAARCGGVFFGSADDSDGEPRGSACVCWHQAGEAGGREEAGSLWQSSRVDLLCFDDHDRRDRFADGRDGRGWAIADAFAVYGYAS